MPDLQSPSQDKGKTSGRLINPTFLVLARQHGPTTVLTSREGRSAVPWTWVSLPLP